MKQRVVITGLGWLSSLGVGTDAIDAVLAGQSGLAQQADWRDIDGLATTWAAKCDDWSKPAHYARKKTRTMGRVALMAAHATEMALHQADLTDATTYDQIGLAYGSAVGSPPSIQRYAKQISFHRTLAGCTASDYIKFMSHTTAANLVQFFGFKDRLIPTCEACTSGSRAIGTAFESIAFGAADCMVAGGAEELAPWQSAFLQMIGINAADRQAAGQIQPFANPSSGTLPGEGAASLILESADRAQQRGAIILGEVLGFGTATAQADFADEETMHQALTAALAQAELEPSEIHAIFAHGLGSDADRAEQAALMKRFGNQTPVTGFKQQLGHTLGASGALETALALALLQRSQLPAYQGAPRSAASLNFVQAQQSFQGQHVLIHNHGFGGISNALIIARKSLNSHSSNSFSIE